MIGALIVTHGNLAFELLNAARQIEADVTGMVAVPLDWNDSVDQARDKIAKGLEEIGPDRHVIIFTDMFGGTPSNISLSFLEQGHIEIVTGVNLPMVIKLASFNREASLRELASEVEDQGKEAICRASILLEPQKMKKDA